MGGVRKSAGPAWGAAGLASGTPGQPGRAAGSAWGACGSGLKGCGPVWEAVDLPGGFRVALRGAGGLSRD